MRTREALAAYSLGLTGIILVKILAPGFYARQNVRMPVRIAFVSLIATQAMNLLFFGWLQHAGLALSIGLAACLNAGLLYQGLRQQGIYQPQPGWAKFLPRLALALIALGCALWFAMGSESDWLAMNVAARLFRLGWLVPFGVAVYFATLWLLGFRLNDFKKRVTG